MGIQLKKMIFLLIVAWMPFSPNAQEIPLDTLSAKAEKYASLSVDSVLVYSKPAMVIAKKQHNLEALADHYYFIQKAYSSDNEMDSARKYIELAHGLVDEISNKEKQSRIFHALGIISYKTGELDSALISYQKEYALEQEMGNIQKQASALGNIGMVYYRQSKYQQAVDNYFKCLKIFEETGQNEKLMLTYNNIGNVYRFWGDYPKALFYYKKTISLLKPESSKRFSAFINNNLAIVYRKQLKYDSAILYYEAARKIYEEINYTKGVASALTGLAITYNKLDQLDKSCQFYLEAIQIQKKVHDQVGLASNYGNMGILLFNFSNPKQALIYLKKSDSLAKKIGYQEVRINNYETFRDVYMKMGNYKKALDYELQYVALNDSIYNLEKLSEIETIQEKYQAEKKQLEINVLNEQARIKDVKLSRKNILIGGLVIIMLLILFITWLINHNYKARANRKRIILENKLLRSQMNPHFLFNSLNAIQTYILQQNPLEGASYLSKFADLMRSILYNSREEFIPLDKEMVMINNYLELQQIRFKNLFTYTIEVDEHIDTSKTIIPPMLAQPFIENAIEHGFKNISYPGILKITFTLQVDSVLLEVHDNGIGIEASLEQNKKREKLHQSLATVISKERLDLFNRRMKKSIFSLDIKQIKGHTEELRGTKVKLTIPYRI